jgi:hypothetical protein
MAGKTVIEVQEAGPGVYEVVRGEYDTAGFQGRVLARITPTRGLDEDERQAFAAWLDHAKTFGDAEADAEQRAALAADSLRFYGDADE